MGLDLGMFLGITAGIFRSRPVAAVPGYMYLGGLVWGHAMRC